MNDLQRLIAPLVRRVRLMVGRAVLTMVNDAAKMQAVQVSLLDGEVADRAEHFQMYGVTSVPLAGAEGVFLSVGGNRDAGVVVCIDDRRYRIQSLAAGEVAIYTHLDQGGEGHRIHFKADGSIELLAKNVVVKAEEKVRLEGDVVELHAATKFRFDVNGHGQEWLGDRVNTWQIGAVAGATNAIAPPEIP